MYVLNTIFKLYFKIYLNELNQISCVYIEYANINFFKLRIEHII